jgi:hypothetical protein
MPHFKEKKKLLRLFLQGADLGRYEECPCKPT